MKTVSTFFLAVIIAICFGGCFEYEEELTLNQDGSGSLDVHYSKYKEADVQLDDVELPKDEEEILTEIKEKWTSEKVRLIDYKIRDNDDIQDVEFTLKFENVLDLNELNQFADSEIRFKNGGRCEFERIITVDMNWDDEESSTFEQVVKSIVEKTVLEKIKFRFEVIMPRDISKSNARWIRSNRHAVWKFDAVDLSEGDIDMVVKCK